MTLVFAVGLASVGIALLLLLAETHLSTVGLIAVGAVLALVSGVALLVIGATDGLGAVAGGVSVAAIGSVLLIGRSLRRPQHGERSS